MASLLSSPILIQPVQNQKCVPYNNQLAGYKNGRSKYYKLQIEFYINQHGTNKKASEAFSYFDIPDLRNLWSRRYFDDQYYEIRTRMNGNNGDAQVSLTPTVSTQRTSPANDQYVIAAEEMKTVLQRICSRKDHISHQTKQTLLSSVMRLDSNGKLLNRSFIQFLCPSLINRNVLLTKCMSIKQTFNTTDTSLLHDPKAANKGGAHRVFPEYIDKHIDNFWVTNCTDDPNTRKHRVLNKRTPNRKKHRHLLCHKKFKTFYNDWIDVAKKSLNLTRIPSLSYFMNLKPCFVYKVKSGDYSQCKKCFNFESLNKAFLRRLSVKGTNKICSVNCPNHDWYAMDSDECSCDDCYDNTATLNALRKSPLRLLQHLCCVNHSKYPDIDCVEGLCTNSQCGTFKIQKLLRSNLINIPNDDEIRFKKIITIDRPPKPGKTKGTKCHATVWEKLSWVEFIPYFIKELGDYLKHYNIWIHQHQTRRDYVDKKFGRIGDDSIYCHFDFINNIKVLFDEMSNGMWGDREAVTFMVSYDRFRDENDDIIEESASYFCDDPKHGWSAAVTFIRKHLKKRINDFKQRYNRKLEKVFCWSDNGEFKCSGFLCLLCQIAEELDVVIYWCFTAGGHSKGKHDGEGHVIKCEYRSAILEGMIRFDIQNEAYSITIKKYMEKFFGENEDQFKFKRTFHHVPKEEIKHVTRASVCERLDGINGYHAFLMMHSKELLVRELTCYCDWCVSLGWKRCKVGSVCGVWRRYIWGKGFMSSAVSSKASSNNMSSLCSIPPLMSSTLGTHGNATSNVNNSSSYSDIPSLNSDIPALCNNGYPQQQQNQYPMYSGYHSSSDAVPCNSNQTRFPY